jgi:hypothetical protein
VSWATRLLLLAVGLALFLPGVGARDLWNPDEPRYAEVAREMRERGDLLVPHLNGRLYAEKPPLHFWSIALVSRATGGVDEVATRLPSVVAAIATLFLLFGIARRLFDREVAWTSVAVFATSAKILWQGRIGQIDMTLVALVTLAMYAFVRGMTEGRHGFFRLFFVAAGLATLAKGPVGLLPPLLSIVAFALAARRGDLLRRLRIPSGLAIWAAIVLAWLVPAILSAGREYFEIIVLKQNVGRYADPWHHFQPWYYYLTVIPADFFPWAFFLPGAIRIGWRRFLDRERLGYLFALAWVVVTLVFFSLSPGKRTVYILTMYPAMALLVGASFAEIRRSWPSLRGWLVVPAALLALLLTALPAAGYWLVRYRPERFAERLEERLRELEPMGPGLLPLLLALGLALSAGALAAFLGALRGSPRRVTSGVALGMGAAAVGACLWILPRFDAVKSVRPMAEALAARAAPDEPYAIYPRFDPPVVFYSRRIATEIEGEEALRAFAGAPGRRWLLIERDELARLEPPLPMLEVARDPDRPDGYALLFAGPSTVPAPGG